MSFLTFLTQNIYVIIFYLAIVLIIYFNRKKFEVQAKVIYLYKTKFGLKFMDKFVKPRKEKIDKFGKFSFDISAGLTILSGLVLFIDKVYTLFTKSDLLTAEVLFIFLIVFLISFIVLLISIILFKQLRKAGTLGIYVGFFGMILITIFVIKGFFDLFLKPGAPPILSPVIPGVTVPGSPVMVPFWFGIIALFIVVLIHEFSHGILCRVHKIKVKSTGVGMMAILPLAFVEPDEESLRKSSFNAKNSMYAAGPFSNILTGILVIFLLMFILFPITFSMTENIIGGVELFAHNGTPANIAGIGTQGSMLIPLDVINKYPVSVKNSEFPTTDAGVLINNFNGVNINSTEDFIAGFKDIKPGDKITLSNNKQTYTITTINNSGVAYIGVNIVSQKLKETASTFWFKLLNILLELFIWVYTLSFGLGLANLLPLGITDGGRMIHSTLLKWMKEKKAMLLFSRITIIFLMIILIMVILPIVRALV